MELEKLKTDWNMLNEKVNKMEKLNHRAIEQMIRQKVATSQEKVMSFEKRFLFLSFSFTGLYALQYLAFHSHISRMELTPAFWLFEAVMIAAGLWQWYKVQLLKKMNVETCTPTELVEQSIRFKVITQIRLLVGMVLLIPITAGFLYFLQPILEMDRDLIFVMIGAVLAGIAIGLLAERRHIRNINALIKSLKEIKDLEK